MKKTISILLAGIVVLSTLTWCTNTSTQTKTDTKQTVKVWVIAPLSWPAANYWEDAINAYNFITEKFNTENKNIQIQLVIEDSKCDAKSAVSAVQKLINIDKVQAIVWELCSLATIPAAKIAQANKVVMISPISSAPEIANIWEYAFRYYNDKYVTQVLWKYLKEHNAKKIFVLAENTDACIWYLNGIKENFSWEVISETYQSNEKDFWIIAKRIKDKSDQIDYLVFLPNNDGNVQSIITSLDKEWLLEKLKWKIITNELISSSQTYTALWNKIDGIKTTQLVNLNSLWERANNLIKDFQTKFTITSDPLWTVLEAESLNIVLDAIKTNWYNSDSIKNYFNSFNWASQRDWYFGKYYFSPQRDAVWLNFLVYEVKDGKLINSK